jgi:hypothetical protein
MNASSKRDTYSQFFDIGISTTSLGKYIIQNSGIVSKGGIFANLFLDEQKYFAKKG